MKALSKRRGRPRKLHVVRTPSGAISRSKKEAPSKLALEARAKMHRISIEAAHDQQAGQWLGRLHMAYLNWRKGSKEPCQPVMSLATAHYHALLSYQQTHNDHAKAVSSPGAVYEAKGGNTGGDPEAHERWCRTVIESYDKARKAISEQQKYDPGNLWAALDHCVIQEQQMPHMIGDLKTLGVVLARHYKTR